MSQIAAVDLGGTLMRSGWLIDGQWRHPAQVATPDLGGAESLIAHLAAQAIAPDGTKAEALVVATAGTLQPQSGYLVEAANLPLRAVPLRQRLSESLSIPVAVVGDAWAATVAEFSHGAGRSLSDGLFVTVSTGIGLGLVIDGRLVSGHGHQAGELGHVPVRTGDDAPACVCGQTGCLELYASGSGLVARYRELAGQPASATQILAWADQGLELAVRVVEQGADLLATVLAGLIRLLAPQAVIGGGGLWRSDHYVGLVRRRCQAILANTVPDVGAIFRTATSAPTPGLVGAGLLGAGDPAAWRLAGSSSFAPQFQGFGL